MFFRKTSFRGNAKTKKIVCWKKNYCTPGTAGYTYNELCCSFEEGKSDKEILDNLLLATRYDKRLLPPVQGTLRLPSHCQNQGNYTPHLCIQMTLDHPEHLEHHRHRYHHTAPHNHSSLLTPRRKSISSNVLVTFDIFSKI